MYQPYYKYKTSIMAPLLGYWDIRGLATPIRLLLEHAGVQYDEKLYKCGPPPNFDRGEWLNDKFSLGLAFPNLPYYIDGDVKLTQSHVIMRYLARKHNLAGKTETEKCLADLLANQVFDYHMDYAKIAYNPEFSTLKEAYLEAMPAKLKQFTDFLAGRKFVAGDEVTYADFVFFEYLEGQKFLSADLLKGFPELEQYHARMASLESVDKYFKSPKAIKFPFNGAPAYFGGAYSDQLLK